MVATRARRRGAALALVLCAAAALCCAAGAQAPPPPPPAELHRSSLDAFAVHAARLAPDPRVTLRVNATRLARSGAWVAVSWAFASGASVRPSANDIVAYYVPADADITTKAPVKFQNASGGATGTLRCALRLVVCFLSR